MIGILDRLSNDVSELRGDFAELRHQTTVGFERTEQLIAQGLRRQTQFFVLAWATMLAAIVGLYAR